MRILDVRALRGPNYWSGFRDKLILMRLDLEEYEEKPTNRIEGFYEKLKTVMPGMYHHQCSYHVPGGFYKRIEEGTWAGHVIEHMALELETLAGMNTGFGRTRGTAQRGVYNIVFSYIEEEAGIYAARSAVELFLHMAENNDTEAQLDMLKNIVCQLAGIYQKVKLGPSTQSIVDEAIARDIPVMRLDENSLIQLGYGINQKRIRATTTCSTSSIALDLACDKFATKELLSEMGLPVPAGLLISDMQQLQEAAEELGYPLVIKPLDANHGKGVSTNLNTPEQLKDAYKNALQYSGKILLEKYVSGKDYRILVIDGKFTAAAERIPACVTGDGIHTINELAEQENMSPWRGCDHENYLSKITMDEHSLRFISRFNYSIDTILPKGEVCYLRPTANLSTGGTAIDRTDEVHTENIALFERAARIIGLDIAGIDVIAGNIHQPLTQTGGVIIEVNAAPGFRMHLFPSVGRRRNVAKNVLDMLYPDGAKSRIPLFAITGTNGKTTTTRLIAHIFSSIDKKTGVTTSDGIYIDGRLIQKGDNTGPLSAQIVLKDPSVEIAVLETARGGILRSGLAFRKCDVGVITNVSSDHLGMRDIHSLEEMARVKSVVANSVKKEGYVILNADDPLVYRMKDEVDGKVCLFSMDSNSPNLVSHVRQNGIAAAYNNGSLYILKGNLILFVEKTDNIPLTFSGRAPFMIQNVLAAMLACFVFGVRIADIRRALKNFSPSVAQTPGRLNFIEFENFSVLIDYAHNSGGFAALKDFLGSFNNPVKTGIFGGTGDRRDEDITELGRIAATMFTNIIIKDDESERRGRQRGEMCRLIMNGIRSKKPDMPVEIIEKESDAVIHALDKAVPGELIVLLADNLQNVVSIVQERKIRERSFARINQ
ncbi:MAG: cyanophycin synthetase [Bacteroidota bacterium]